MTESPRIIYMCKRGIVGGIAVGQGGPTEGNIFSAQLLVEECNDATPQFVEQGGSRTNGECPGDCELFKLASLLPRYNNSKTTG